jgi:hypothetical protein
MALSLQNFKTPIKNYMAFCSFPQNVGKLLANKKAANDFKR